jgi:hypothetical protein
MLGLAVAVPARAQSTERPAEPASADKEGKTFHAFYITGAAPRLDGRLDDEVWKLAESISDFAQMDPDNMAPATERTTVQVAYDARYIYVGVRCFSWDPSQVSTGLGRRDNFPRSDRILVAFDTRHDQRTA